MTKYIVALDQGTSSCRAILVNTAGQIVSITQAEFTQHFPKSGWVEHDANEIWTVQMRVFEDLLKKNDLSASNIISIGITNQRETTVVWDKSTGKPIYNAIVWQDRRTANICEQLKADKQDEYIYANTGLVVDSYFSGTKVKWLLENVPGAKAKAQNGELLAGTIDTWLIWKMTEGRNHVTDQTNASRTLLYNIRKHKWDSHILDILDIPESMLGKVLNSADDFGIFKYKGVNIAIQGVAGDQQSALFGQACFDKGTAKNTYGTGCFMLMNIGDQFQQSKNGLLTTLCCDEYGKPSYALEGSIFIAGAAIQWLRDGLKIISDAAETEGISSAIQDEHDVVVVPAFAGLGAPYWDMYARGAIFGLSRGSEQPQIVKATLDSLAYQTYDVLNAMQEDAGIKLASLKVDGGACANNYLMQFQADVLTTTVERPKNIETTAMGAAYLAGISADLWDHKVIVANREVDKQFEPKMESEKRVALLDQWKEAVTRTRNWIKPNS